MPATKPTTPLDLIEAEDFATFGDCFYTMAARGEGIVKVANLGTDWDDITPADLALAETDPADGHEAMRWCVLFDDIPECDGNTAVIAYLDPDSGGMVMQTLSGPEHDHHVATRAVAARIGATSLSGLPVGPKWADRVRAQRAAPALKVEEPEPVTPAKAADPKRPVIGNAAALRSKAFAPIKYVVPGFIVEGCTIIAGRPKLGKSWLMLDVGIAVARGSTCLGSVQCEQGDVLYLALEDNERRMHSRISKLMPKLIEKEWPAAFHYATEWPRQDGGGVKYIEEWLDSHPNARMVIVDVLAMFRPMQNGKQNAYEQDYLAVKSLHRVASDRGVAVVIVTHTKKGVSESGDPFELVSGTLGLTGAADSTLVLDRDSQGCTLYGRGRDIQEIESAVAFDPTTCKWRLLGQAAEVRRSDERGQILAVLGGPDNPSSATQIAADCDLKLANVRVLLGKMVRDGEAQRIGVGKYALPGEPSNREDNPTPHYTGYTVIPDPANDDNSNRITGITGGKGRGAVIEAAA